jgi:hypothetical protein
MFVKITVALAMIIVVCSDAVAAPKRQPAAPRVSGRAQPTDICKQTGPITMHRSHNARNYPRAPMNS